MTEDEGFQAAAYGIAFHLLADAFADLAEAHLAVDPNGGLRLLHELQNRVATQLRRFASEHPGLARQDILRAAALSVRTVLREAQGEFDR